MKCRICKNNSLKNIFHHKILNKYNVGYYFCDKCGFIQTEKPFWLEESYKNSIDISDAGYYYINIIFARKTWILFVFLFGFKGEYLDYAGGYGLFTRMMRDFGLDFYNYDKYTKNIFSSGFDYNNQKIKAISCFECFEHLENPIEEIAKILSISKNLLFSTLLFSDKNIPGSDWWYYAFDHGQHISFYSIKTLKYIAKENNVFLYSNKKNIHLFLERKVSNFLFILLLKIGVFPWDIFYRLFVKSKTYSDYRYLKNNNNFL